MVFVIANVQQAIQDLDVKTATHARQTHVKMVDNLLTKTVFVIASAFKVFPGQGAKAVTPACRILVKMADSQ